MVDILDYMGCRYMVLQSQLCVSIDHSHVGTTTVAVGATPVRCCHISDYLGLLGTMCVR